MLNGVMLCIIDVVIMIVYETCICKGVIQAESLAHIKRSIHHFHRLSLGFLRYRLQECTLYVIVIRHTRTHTHISHNQCKSHALVGTVHKIPLKKDP